MHPWGSLRRGVDHLEGLVGVPFMSYSHGAKF
jgi:hypothetical protein